MRVWKICLDGWRLLLSNEELGFSIEHVQDLKVVIVQTKSDRLTCLDDQELDFLLGLSGVVAQWGEQLKVVKANRTEGGYDALIGALRSICK
jgi:hypothetical protein